jgi:hypothetical protein
MTQPIPINTIEAVNPPNAKRGGQDRNRRCAVGDKYQRITHQAVTGRATEASMNNVTMGFALISAPPLSLRPRGARDALHARRARPDPSIPIDPHERGGRRAMTTETPEPRFERFCLAYPSGTVVMHYGGGAALGDVRVTHPLAVVEAVEASWVSVGIPEAGRFEDV